MKMNPQARLVWKCLGIFVIAVLLSWFPPLAVRAESNSAPIKHIVMIVEEHHSFDNYFGSYPGADGPSPSTALPNSTGSTVTVKPFHIPGSVVSRDLCHSWQCARQDFNSGKMDNFVVAEQS